MSNKTQQLKKAMQSWWVRAERARFEYGVLGRTNADGTVTVEADRQDYVYVTLDTGTLTIAYNGGNGTVDSRAGLPVRVRDDIGNKIIDGVNTGGFSSGDSNAPSKVYSVNDVEPDSHGNVTLNLDDIADVAASSPADGDLLGYSSTSGDWVNASTIPVVQAATIHAATSKTTPVDADEVGLVDSAASNILKKLTWANIKATLKTYFDTVYTFANIVTDDSITNAKLRNSGALSVIGRSANSSGDPADISASAASGAVLRESGSALGFGTVATAGIADDAVTFIKMQNIATDSLIGRDTASTGDPENILLNSTLSMDGSGNLQRAALTGDVTASAGSNATTIANDAVTNAKAANMANATVKGRTTAGTGDPEDLTMAQLVALIEAQALYLLLAGRSGGQTVTGLTGTGSALTVTRNQALANTDSPVVAMTQTNTGDDQAALYAKQFAASFTTPTARFVHEGTGSMLVALENYSGNASGNAGFAGMRARGTEASPVIVNASDVLGFITYQGYDGAAFQLAASITVTVDGTPGAGDMPGRIDFATTPDGSASPSTALRLNSNQDAGFGGVTSPAARVDVLQPTLGSPVLQLASTASNDDPTEIIYQNRLATTNNTITTIHTFTVPSSTTYFISGTVIARRTGGSAGTAEDGAAYTFQATYQNVAGTATLIGPGGGVTSLSENQAGWDCVLSPTGATVRVRVTGATNNNITWHMTARVNLVSS